MAVRKTTKTPLRSSSAGQAKETVAEAVVANTVYNEISYDTKMLIVIILLLFVYPIGLIFMWLWMNTWPAWVKIIITLPFILGAAFVLFMIYAISSLIRNGSYNYYRYYRNQERMERMRQRMWNNPRMMNATPTVFLPPKNTY